MTKFQDRNLTNCRLGNKCKKGHIGSNGYNLRHIHGQCQACQFKLPDGPYTEVFENVPLYEYAVSFYNNDEERRVAHIQRVIEWRKKNKDKVNEWQRNYDNKPEVKERNRIKRHNEHKAKMEAMTEEEQNTWHHKRYIRRVELEMQRKAEEAENIVKELDRIKNKLDRITK
jgi:hypothetical protein